MYKESSCCSDDGVYFVETGQSGGFDFGYENTDDTLCTLYASAMSGLVCHPEQGKYVTNTNTLKVCLSSCQLLFDNCGLPGVNFPSWTTYTDAVSLCEQAWGGFSSSIYGEGGPCSSRPDGFACKSEIYKVEVVPDNGEERDANCLGFVPPTQQEIDEYNPYRVEYTCDDGISKTGIDQDNTPENSEANTTIEIKLKPYVQDWGRAREMILFEPYVPSPIVSTSCSNKCPCSFPDEDDCGCNIEMVCGGTIPIDLASGDELKFVWEASSDNDKYISVKGSSGTRVEFRLQIEDCTAPYQLIHGSNVTIAIDGLDGIEQKYAFDAESSFVILGSPYGDRCDVYTRMEFDPNENGVLDMKFKTLAFSARYDNTEVTDETSYIWATDSYTWIRQPEGGSIELLDIAGSPLAPTQTISEAEDISSICFS